MKRDMDLCREILQKLEEREFRSRVAHQELLIEGINPATVAYHVKLLYEAGYIEATDEYDHLNSEYTIWTPSWLTWEGHEFLDAARPDERWDKAKNMITDHATSVPFSVLAALLAQLAMKAVGM